MSRSVRRRSGSPAIRGRPARLRACPLSSSLHGDNPQHRRSAPTASFGTLTYSARAPLSASGLSSSLWARVGLRAHPLCSRDKPRCASSTPMFRLVHPAYQPGSLRVTSPLLVTVRDTAKKQHLPRHDFPWACGPKGSQPKQRTGLRAGAPKGCVQYRVRRSSHSSHTHLFGECVCCVPLSSSRPWLFCDEHLFLPFRLVRRPYQACSLRVSAVLNVLSIVDPSFRIT